MAEQRTKSDRRSEQRHDAAGRVFWNKPGRHIKYAAWLSDASPSGTSFVTETSTRLSVGDVVEVQPHGADSAPQRCRVTRIAPYDRRLSLVAGQSAGEGVLQ